MAWIQDLLCRNDQSTSLPLVLNANSKGKKYTLSYPVSNECFFNLKVFSTLQLDVTGENQPQSQNFAVQFSASLQFPNIHIS